MKEKVQSILSWEERVSSCTLSTGLPGRCIVVAIPCGRHAWADHHIRFHSQSHSPTISYTGRFFQRCRASLRRNNTYDHPPSGGHKGPLPTSAPPPPLCDPSPLPSTLT